jgi:DNA-binding protein H-NS
MRQPRDFDAELKALEEKTKNLRERKLRQLGELVIATGAHALPVEEIAGALLDAAGSNDKAAKEAYRERGAAFFRQPARRSGRGAGDNALGGQADRGGAEPPASDAGTA